MLDGKAFAALALSFPATEDCSHFERTGFRIIGKRMFTTYFERDNTANIFLTPEEQKVFCELDKKNIYPVPNKWGEKGVTTFEISNLAKEVVMEALNSAYEAVLKKK